MLFRPSEPSYTPRDATPHLDHYWGVVLEASNNDAPDKYVPPRLAFDVSYGDILPEDQVINIDSVALQDTLRRHEAPSDNSALLVTFMPRSTSLRNVNLHGWYDSESNEAVVYSNLDKPRSLALAGSTLTHELSHYTDYQGAEEGTSSFFQRAKYAVGYTAADITPASFMVNILASSTVMLANPGPGFFYDMLHSAWTISGCTAIGSVILSHFYFNDPDEKRARDREELTTPGLITLTPSQEL